MKPNTQYTKSGRINIAYQVFGDGMVDLVYIPGWVSNIDYMWSCPELVEFLKSLSEIARVILFDKRGTGLSDRIIELSTLEERMDDIRAVMDAVGSKKAVLFGHSEGGSVSALFAATYPERTISLITFGVFAKRRYAPVYPWAPTDEERQAVYDMIENGWGSGNMNLASLAPSKAHDARFMDWLASYFRSGASPSAALNLTKMNTEVDIIGILNSIKVPTLLMQRTHDIDVKIEEGRFISRHIPGSKFVEFDGYDHLFWVGNTKEILEEITAFIGNLQPPKKYEKKLMTIASVRIVDVPSTERRLPSGADHDNLIKQLVERYRGRIVHYSDHVFLTTFEGPSKAVHCAIDMQDAIKAMDARLAIGIHIGECLVYSDEEIRGEAVDVLKDVQARVQPDQIVVTETVKNLLSGAGLNFVHWGSLLNAATGQRLPLLSVKDRLREDMETGSIDFYALSKNDSFLENVLQSIENHLSSELFGVENLCRDIGISERQLQRKLKLIANKSPNQMIRSVRLHRAKELIMSKDRGIAEAAFDTGFSNPSYFSKCFKEEFGMLPSALS